MSTGNYSLRYDPNAAPGLASTTVFPVLDVAPPATTGYHETAGAPASFATVSQIAALISPSLGPVTTTSVTITQGTIVALAQGITHTVTWNNAGVTFTAQKINITDSASNAASLIADWQVGNVSQFAVDKAGNLTISNAFRCNTAVVGSGGQYQFSGRSRIVSSVDGLLRFLNTAQTGFTRLTLGPETALFPSLKVNGANVQVRLGDDSGFTGMAAGSVAIGSAVSATSPFHAVGLPTSSAGLATGDFWLNSNVLTIVP